MLEDSAPGSCWREGQLSRVTPPGQRAWDFPSCPTLQLGSRGLVRGQR